MKKIIAICFLLFIAGNSFAQQITFQKTYGGASDDFGNSVRQTADGGYIIAGYTYSFGAGIWDVYLIKTDASGDTLWTNTFGGTSYDFGYSVQQTTDGGYIVAGVANSFGAGSSDVYIIKTDANGNLLWTKTFGGVNSDVGYSVQQTTDGGYIITGSTNSLPPAPVDVYLIKTDANGDTLWTKAFDGGSNDNGLSVQQTSDGGYVITGFTWSFGAGSSDVYLIKTDANGNLVWTKTFGGTNNDIGYSVQQTADGGYIITAGTSSFGAGGWDVYLIKTDSNGNSLWTKTFGGTANDYVYSVLQVTDGGYIIGGRTWNFPAGFGYVYLIKTTANGDTLWTKTFGGTSVEYGNSVQQTMSGGYVITGSTLSFGVGSYDVYLIKTDSIGNSGCFEGSQATIVGSPATLVTSPATMVSSPATIVTTPATIVGSGGTITTLCTTVGIQSAIPNLQSVITIFPNPTPPDASGFTITFPGMINKGTIEIYNVLGEKMMEDNIFNTAQKEIQLKNITAGIYFVKVSGEEKEYAEKFVVE